MSPIEVGFSLGSNLSDRLSSLRQARDALAAQPGITLSAVSPVYETAPVNVPAEHQEKCFLNAVVITHCSLSPSILLERIQNIESRLGRVRTTTPNTPRTIDIDILYMDNLTVSTPDLTLPHPRWRVRRFVVQPLADVRPDLKLPNSPLSVREILFSLPKEPNVVLFSRNWENS